MPTGLTSQRDPKLPVMTKPAGRRLDWEADIRAGLLNMQITAHASSSSRTFASFSSIGASYGLTASARIDVAYHTRWGDKMMTRY
jgi:hypothetical protein